MIQCIGFLLTFAWLDVPQPLTWAVLATLIILFVNVRGAIDGAAMGRRREALRKARAKRTGALGLMLLVGIAAAALFGIGRKAA